MYSKKIVSSKRIAESGELGYSASAINGCIGEVQCAQKMESLGEKVIEFGKNVKSQYGRADFDVETIKYVVESKSYRNWEQVDIYKFKKQLAKEVLVAEQYGKQMGFYSASAIPENIKKWLIKKNITIFEN